MSEGTALNGGDWSASSFKYIPAVRFKWHKLGFTVHDINFLCGHQQRYKHPVHLMVMKFCWPSI